MTWATVAVGAVSIGSSLIGGASAKKAAVDAAREQADLTYAQRQEEIRQKKRSGAQQLGQARAAVGASNIQFSGSADRYLTALDMENMREVAWAQNAAVKEREAIKAGASGAGTPFFAQAAGDAIGFAAQSYANRSMPSVSDHYGPAHTAPKSLGG